MEKKVIYLTQQECAAAKAAPQNFLEGCEVLVIDKDCAIDDVAPVIDIAKNNTKIFTFAVVVNPNDADKFSKYVDNVAIADSEESIKHLVCAINNTLTIAGHVSICVGDYKAVFSMTGFAAASVGIAEGARGAVEAAKIALQKMNAKNSKFLIMLVETKDGNSFKLGDLSEMNNMLKEHFADSNPDIVWGTTSDNTLDEHFRVTVIASTSLV